MPKKACKQMDFNFFALFQNNLSSSMREHLDSIISQPLECEGTTKHRERFPKCIAIFQPDVIRK